MASNRQASLKLEEAHSALTILNSLLAQIHDDRRKTDELIEKIKVALDDACNELNSIRQQIEKAVDRI